MRTETPRNSEKTGPGDGIQVCPGRNVGFRGNQRDKQQAEDVKSRNEDSRRFSGKPAQGSVDIVDGHGKYKHKAKMDDPEQGKGRGTRIEVTAAGYHEPMPEEKKAENSEKLVFPLGFSGLDGEKDQKDKKHHREKRRQDVRDDLERGEAVHFFSRL